MRASIAAALTVALSIAGSASAAKILMNNDDGFGSGNIREFYRILKEAGHEGTLSLPPFTPNYT